VATKEGTTIEVAIPEKIWEAMTPPEIGDRVVAIWNGNEWVALHNMPLFLSEDEVLTDREAGQLLRMVRSRVVKFAKNSQIPAVILPDGEVRFIKSELWYWLKREASRPPAPSP